MKIIFLLIFTFSINVFSQNAEMLCNENIIDKEYIANSKIKTQFVVLNLNNKNEITVFAEKTNDSIFSIYMSNNSKDSISIAKQDWRIYLIQEAKNKDGKWKPIEYWRNSWCGNSYLSQTLKPNEIIKTDSKAYVGNYKTEIRFKILVNEKNYYSNILKGEINDSQFIFSDSAKAKSGYYRFSKIGGDNIAQKVIFIESNGVKEFSIKNKKYVAWLRKKAEKRNKKESQ